MKKNKNGDEVEPYFDFDCLKAIEQKWNISQKEIIISSILFDLEKEENKTLTPLLKSYEKNGCDWKEAYQAVKHNRVKNLKEASIKHATSALAALFLLNIYYDENKIEVREGKIVNTLSRWSDIFVVKVKNYSGEGDNTGKDFPEYVYILKNTDHSMEVYKKGKNIDFEKQKTALVECVEFNEFIRSGKKLSKSSIWEAAVEVGRWWGKKELEKYDSIDGKKQFLKSFKNYEKWKETLKIKGDELNESEIERLGTYIGEKILFEKIINKNMRESYSAIKNATLEIVINKGQKIYL